ncbi:E3 ubiquitin ligase BIG BROTHER-related-like [Solanum verrucosum]|uniref:E3 ubiquitin ligase BIG BROTHER-related-like n=1 Tax=Solanum verrucosum TaxID=315347 RepID=UPI0020D1C032|nr:E3 ubiquitin ligase BIG BROTHER-related-like [Solanum verrucosum]
MESNTSNVDNSTFSGNSTPANVPIDGGMTESIVGNILSPIEEQRPAYQDIYHRYLALSSTQALIPVKLLHLTNLIFAGSRLLAFYLSMKTHTYQFPKSTCLDGKERCSICLDDYYDKEKLTEISCGHIYHFDCIREWIKLKNICPICKRDPAATIS